MQLRLEISDDEEFRNITEAGLDYFYVSEENVLGLEGENTTVFDIQIYPNPSTGEFHVSSTEELISISVFDAQGRSVGMVKNNDLLDLTQVEDGVYFVVMLLMNGERVVRRVVKG
jgi:hypothetical protein